VSPQSSPPTASLASSSSPITPARGPWSVKPWGWGGVKRGEVGGWVGGVVRRGRVWSRGVCGGKWAVERHVPETGMPRMRQLACNCTAALRPALAHNAAAPGRWQRDAMCSRGPRLIPAPTAHTGGAPRRCPVSASAHPLAEVVDAVQERRQDRGRRPAGRPPQRRGARVERGAREALAGGARGCADRRPRGRDGGVAAVPGLGGPLWFSAVRGVGFRALRGAACSASAACFP
jgi:hypothetical protein